MDTVKSIYIETSVPSFFYTLRSDPESVARMHWTQQWWEQCSKSYDLFSSAAVIAELQRGKSTKTLERIDLLSDISMLSISSAAIEIAEVYIKKLIMPKDPEGDALHLALASYYKCDALLTWNCRHIANANKFSQIRRVNYGLGLTTPILATPLNFFDEDNDNA